MLTHLGWCLQLYTFRERPLSRCFDPHWFLFGHSRKTSEKRIKLTKLTKRRGWGYFPQFLWYGPYLGTALMLLKNRTRAWFRVISIRLSREAPCLRRLDLNILHILFWGHIVAYKWICLHLHCEQDDGIHLTNHSVLRTNPTLPIPWHEPGNVELVTWHISQLTIF